MFALEKRGGARAVVPHRLREPFPEAPRARYPPRRSWRRDRGAVDWTAITALMATITAIAALVMVARVFREIRHERRETRFAIALDALWRLGDEWATADLADARSSAAASLLAGRASDDIDVVLRFFDRIAFLAPRAGFSDEMVWHEFYWPLASYWFASEDYRKHLRPEDAARWHDLDELVQRVVRVEAEHRLLSPAEVRPKKDQLREFLLGEVSAGECSEGEGTDVGPL